MLTSRYSIAACFLLVVTTAGAWAAPTPADEFALLTTRAGVIQFGLVVGESDEIITLRSLKSLKDTVFGKNDLLSSKRNLDENDAFAQEELPYALLWRLSKSPAVSPDGSARPGRLAIVPFAVESGVSADGLSTFQTNLSTIISQHKIEVVEPGQVQKTLTELSVQDPLTPPVLPLGKTLKADWVFTGKVLYQDKVRTLHYRLIDVQSERTLIAGVKFLPFLGQTPAPAAATPEKKVVLSPAKPVDLTGKWQMHTTKSTLAVMFTSLDENKYVLGTTAIYGGEYQLRGNALVMVKPSYRTYAANASEMMIWRPLTDGSFVLTNTRWAGNYLTRDISDKTQTDPAKAPPAEPPAK